MGYSDMMYDGDTSNSDLDWSERFGNVLLDPPLNLTATTSAMSQKAVSGGNKELIESNDGDTSESDRDLSERCSNVHLVPPLNLTDHTTSAMSPKVFTALRGGKIEILERNNDHKKLESLVTEQGNSILHIAAATEHSKLAKEIITKYPNLIIQQNIKGNLPLHVAASSGDLNVVQVIVKSIKYLSIRNRRLAFDIYRSKNQNGDTPLHCALKRNHVEAALCIYYEDRSLSFDLNNEKVSPLYLAVEAGNVELVNNMLIPDLIPETSSNANWSDLKLGKSVVHAAIRAKNIDILEKTLRHDLELSNLKDEEGRTCLSFAVSMGYHEGVSCLLSKITSDIYICDDDGYFPIHMAAKHGHIKIINMFLKDCPNSKELLTKQGQNILHIAAKYGKANVVKYMLKLDTKGKLINEEDMNGNTPLLLATRYWHPKVVSLLTWDSRVDLKTQNNDGYTALDITEKNMDPSYVLRERLTWMALISARAPRGRKLITTNNTTIQKRRSLRNKDGGKYKDRVNTLLLVATLVATMTFAAGFTLPGGYNSSVPNIGMAILTEKTAFKVFLICNTVAMYSSVVTIVALIWAQLGDLALIIKVFQLALPLLGIALTSMSVAFMAGVSLVVSHVLWLSYLILGINSMFLLAMLLLLIPYVSPQTPSQRFLRHIFYYPYFLMLLAVGDHNNRD